MAQTQGSTTFGTLIYMADPASPSVYDVIDEAYSIGAVSSTTELVDFTHHESPGGFEENKPSGVQVGDTIQVECNNVAGNTSQNMVRTAHANKTTDSWKVVMASGQNFTFLGIVIQEQTDASDIRGKEIFRFQVKIAGAIVRADV